MRSRTDVALLMRKIFDLLWGMIDDEEEAQANYIADDARG